MGKLRKLSPELWPLIYVILFSYIELIFRGGVSCLPAALLFIHAFTFQGQRQVNISRLYKCTYNTFQDITFAKLQSAKFKKGQ